MALHQNTQNTAASEERGKKPREVFIPSPPF